MNSFLRWWLCLSGLGLASCVTLDRPATPIPEEEPIRLTIRNPEPVARHEELASGGVPFPAGRLFDPAALQVFGPDGAPVPVQAHPLGIRWPDGSIRRALVQFPVSVGAGATAVYGLSTNGGPSAPVEKPVRVIKTGSGVTVDTGAVRFFLPRAGAAEGRAFLPVDIAAAENEPGRHWIEDAPRVRYIADREHLAPEAFAEMGLHPNTLWSFGLGGIPGEYAGGRLYNRYAFAPEGYPANTVPWHDWSDIIERNVDYSALFSGPVELEVEEAGPLRAVVFFRSAREAHEGNIGFSGRIYAYAGQALVRVELTIENYEEFPPVGAPAGAEPELPHTLHIANTKHVRAFALRFRPSFAVRSVLYGGDGGDPVEGAPGTRLLQDRADRFRIENAGGAEVATGERARGWISATDGERTFSLASKYFWEIFPKALACEGETGDLMLELWPEDTPPPGYPFTPGRVRTYEFVLGFDVDGPAASAAARSELRSWVDPEYASATGATHRVVPAADAASSPSLSGFIARTAERFRNQQLMYGDIHFGDQTGWSRLSAASGYHGVAHEFFVYYLATGDPEIFRLAEAAAWHNLDIDQFHWGEQAGGHVKQHTRLRDHATIRVMGGIAVWNFGDVDYYFLTGRRRVLPALERTADWLMGCGGFTPGTFTNERGAGLPFKHLAYMVEALADEAAFDAVFPGSFPETPYPARADAVGFEKSLGYVERLRDVSAHFINIYEQGLVRPVSFMASYPPEGFYRLWRLTGDETARRGVALSADFLYHRIVLPTGLPIMSSDERTHMVDSPWRNWGAFYDEVDLPAALAYEATGNDIYLSYAYAPLAWRLLFHGIAQDRNGFNSTVPQTLWVLREAGLTEADLHGLRPDLDYEQALEQTMARARMALETPDDLSRSEAETYFRLALEVSRVLTNLGRSGEALEWLAAWRECWEGGREHFNIRGFEMIDALEAHARSVRDGSASRD